MPRSGAAPPLAHLYVMTRSDAPGLLKVGRSDDPERRAMDLQSGHCFFVRVVAVFYNMGHRERAVHEYLRESRVDGGAGREWFRTSLLAIYPAIAIATAGEKQEDANAEAQQELALSAARESRDALLVWIETSCEPVERKNATKMKDFRKAAADHLGVSLMQIGPILTAAGINPTGMPSSNRERVAIGPHPKWAREGTPGLRVK